MIQQWSRTLVGSELRAVSAAYEALQPTFEKIVRSLDFKSIQNLLERRAVWYLHVYLGQAGSQQRSLLPQVLHWIRLVHRTENHCQLQKNEKVWLQPEDRLLSAEAAGPLSQLLSV